MHNEKRRILKKTKNNKSEEVLTIPKPDRRKLPYVPDPEQIRVVIDRRGSKAVESKGKSSDPYYINKIRLLSQRYLADFDVLIIPEKQKKITLKGRAVDISSTGILVELEQQSHEFSEGDIVRMDFNIPPGTMPEGFEFAVNIDARLVRRAWSLKEGQQKIMLGFEFSQPLTSYLQRKRWGYSIYWASSFLFVVTALVMLMRAESIIYFKYNISLYLYSIIAAIFLLSRYFFGALYREVPVNPEFTPGVSIIIPCFNEEKWIHRTILSCINQDYPIDKLEVIVVDDKSTDNSAERIKQVIEDLHKEEDRFLTKDRLKAVFMPKNGGKRSALINGVKLARHDLVAFVDSDSFLEPTAIKHLVQPFQDPKMGGVSGRTEVENKYTNSITKMQAVRYYIAFRIMKAAEAFFDSVTCLSGPLSCYRKDLVLKNAESWLHQKFLGHPATFGDDRSLTNFILKTHRTYYQDSAICSTIVPSNMRVFLKQQMRWKRSWLRESIRAATFIWKKEPFMAAFFYIGLIVPVASPVVVIFNFVYVPLVYHVFPSTFIMGLFLMALMMSFAHLLFRRSKLWIFGLIFAVFYEFVLLWQMPVAWVTFWKSTWGTRETPQDVEEKKKKSERNKKRKLKLPFWHSS
ncbi:MAG: glycosyltransferase [Tepidanaerobacteraceae bacterium]|nr:glycosyltransferase [Tepidanaerobacteraceae bacterium]